MYGGKDYTLCLFRAIAPATVATTKKIAPSQSQPRSSVADEDGEVLDSMVILRVMGGISFSSSPPPGIATRAVSVRTKERTPVSIGATCHDQAVLSGAMLRSSSGGAAISKPCPDN